MKVRFRSNVTRGFSFSLLRDSCSLLRGSLAAFSCGENLRKTSGTRVGLVPQSRSEETEGPVVENVPADYIRMLNHFTKHSLPLPGL